MREKETRGGQPHPTGGMRTPEKRGEPADVSRALDEALMNSFPASDPVSMVGTLIPGTRDEHAPHGEPDGAPARYDTHTTWRALMVTFVLVLIASLLMVEARHSYVFQLTAQHADGIVAVPPM